MAHERGMTRYGNETNALVDEDAPGRGREGRASLVNVYFGLLLLSVSIRETYSS